MAANPKAVFGVFLTDQAALQAQYKLNSHGYSPHDFIIQYPKVRVDKKNLEQSVETMILPFAAIGAAIGGITFLIVGSFTILNLITVAPLPDEFTESNKFLILLSSIFGGLFIGGAIGALIGIGTPQKLSKRYGNYIDAGGILMSVHIEDPTRGLLATDIFSNSGAQEISTLQEVEGWKDVRAKIASNFLRRLTPYNIS